MKKILLLAVALLGMAAGAEAQTLAVDGNEFVALKGKQATLAIKVNNATAVRDVMFDITLPTGITLGEVAPEDATNYKVAISDAKNGNTYTVILYSESGKTGATTINFPLTVPAEYTGELWANLASSTTNGKWTDDAATEASAESTGYTFQVGLLGDADMDKELAINDVVTVALKVRKGTPTRYNAIAADMDGNGEVDINDVVTLATATRTKN